MSIVQNDTSPIILYMVLSSDHVTPATGKTVSVTLSKNGAAFAAGGGTVAELANGFYKYTPVTADVGTLGDLGIRATATSCDDYVDVIRVVQAGPTAADYSTARAAKLDNLDAAISGVDDAVRTNLATELGRIDAAVSSRLASASYTAPDNAGISANGTAIAALNDVSAADILAAVIETNGATTITVQEALQLAAALPGGTIADILAGAGAQTIHVKSASGQTFLAYVTDELGNRASVTRSALT